MIEKLLSYEKKYDELTKRLCDQELISNIHEYHKVAKERASIEEVVHRFNNYRKLLGELEEAQKMLRAEQDPDFRVFLEQEIEKFQKSKNEQEQSLQLLLLPKDPYADRNIIMEIRGGAGGEEAALFAGELFRMYTRYAERRGWKYEVMNSNPTELGGFKEVVFSIAGSGVWSEMKFESGVHRVQRVPATEASGRIHTSTVTVAVLAEAEDVDVQINPQELRIDTYRSSGAGGQHVNKTDSAIRITHLPTGIVVACQDERSQHQNREKAMRILRSTILERLMAQQEQEIAQARRSQVGRGDRSEKIRTYNFPQSRVTDHRIGLTVHSIERFLAGELDEMLQALVLSEQEELLKELI
ncbi:MAG: peptide chain release factor 1 [bacterium]